LILSEWSKWFLKLLTTLGSSSTMANWYIAAYLYPNKCSQNKNLKQGKNSFKCLLPKLN